MGDYGWLSICKTQYGYITYGIFIVDGGVGNSFVTIITPLGTSPVADDPNDSLTYTSTGGTVEITGNATTDTINFEVPSGTYVPYTGATGNVNLGIHNLTLGDSFTFADGSEVSVNTGDMVLTCDSGNVIAFPDSGKYFQTRDFDSGFLATLNTSALSADRTFTFQNLAGILALQATAPLTSGSVIFAGTTGLLTQDNANLFWNDTTNRLGIGTTTPNCSLEVISGGPTIIARQTSGNNAASIEVWNNSNAASSSFRFGYTGSTYPTGIFSSGGLASGLTAWIDTIANAPIQFGVNNIYGGLLQKAGTIINWTFGGSTSNGNVVNIYGASSGDSGLRFLRMTSSTAAVAGSPIGVNSSGDVVRVSGASITSSDSSLTVGGGTDVIINTAHVNYWEVNQNWRPYAFYGSATGGDFWNEPTPRDAMMFGLQGDVSTDNCAEIAVVGNLMNSYHEVEVSANEYTGWWTFQ